MSSSEDSDSDSYVSEDSDDLAGQLSTTTTLAPLAQEQWVKYIEFCSVKSKADLSVPRNIDVRKLCQATDTDFSDHDKQDYGWILSNNNQEENLIISFEQSVFINEICVYESLNPGSIVRMEIFDQQQNKWWPVWQRGASQVRQSTSRNIFQPSLRRYRFKSDTVRITFNPTYADRIGIKAIKLVGSNIFDTNFHCKSISDTMKTLYKQTLHGHNTDVQFIFSDKKIHAHRNILCCRSKYFYSLLSNDFIEKSSTTPLQLTDIDVETFAEILHFIYNGQYHKTISYETSINCMIYANKINLLTAVDAAIEHVCLHLRSNHDLIIETYSNVKKWLPAFGILLNYIYDLCSEILPEICKKPNFMELDKELMVDLIYHATERRMIRDKRNAEHALAAQQHEANDDE